MSKRTAPSILQTFDAELARLIAENREISEMDALRLFLASETHAMLADDDLKLWHFSPLVIYDLWENEEAAGDQRNSLYIRGDEV